MFGERIRDLRIEKGLTQAQMAAQFDLGTKVSTFRSWELEYSQPGIETLIKMADYFDVTVDYLIGRTTSPDKPIYFNGEPLIPPLQRGRYNAILESITRVFHDCDEPTCIDLMGIFELIIRNIDIISTSRYSGRDSRVNKGIIDDPCTAAEYDLKQLHTELISPIMEYFTNTILKFSFSRTVANYSLISQNIRDEIEEKRNRI